MGKPDDRVNGDHPGTRKPDQQQAPELPPRIPPRMKKTRAPDLPEKPAHIRAKTNHLIISSQQPSPAREPLRPRILNAVEKSPRREVLVAACKAGRERPVDKRQREPPKLLKPTGGATYHGRDVAVPPPGHLGESWRDATHYQTTTRVCGWRSDEYAAANSPLWTLTDGLVHRSHKSSGRKPNCPVHRQPILVVPRQHLVAWGSTTAPASHALWSPQRDAVGRATAEKPASKHHQSGTSRGVRSGSVTRSGSLTSQGSASGSEESGGEAFPVSVLKKQRRAPSRQVSRMTDHHQKKNVTFNAFATVQLVDD